MKGSFSLALVLNCERSRGLPQDKLFDYQAGQSLASTIPTLTAVKVPNISSINFPDVVLL